METDKPVLHVVFGMSAAGSLRRALAEAGRDERVIGLADDLSFGPIDPLDAGLRAEWVGRVLGYDDWEEVGQLSDAFWHDATSRRFAPIAWVNRRCARDDVARAIRTNG